MSARPSVPSDLVGAIYEAAASPCQWRSAVERATAWVGGVAGSFQARSASPEPKNWLISTGVDPSCHAAYLAHYCQGDPHLRHIDRLGVHTTLLSSEIIEDAELLRTEYYDGFYRPQRFRDLQGVVLIRNESWVVSLAMFAEEGHRFDQLTKAKLDALAPHFARALRLAFRFEAPTAVDGALMAASSCGALTIVHVDAQLQLIQHAGQDPSHERLRDARLPVFIAGGQLRVRDQAEADKLTRAVELAIAGQGGSVAFGPAASPLVLGFAPAPQRQPFGSERSAMLLFFVGQPANDVRAEPFDSLPATLQEVAKFLAQGASDKDIARELGYSVATARTYTSRVLARLGVRDRRELMKRR